MARAAPGASSIVSRISLMPKQADHRDQKIDAAQAGPLEAEGQCATGRTLYPWPTPASSSPSDIEMTVLVLGLAGRGRQSEQNVSRIDREELWRFRISAQNDENHRARYSAQKT